MAILLELEFEAYCARCGAVLCGSCTGGVTRGRRVSYIDIIPCEKCSEKSYSDGYDRGYDEGYKRDYDYLMELGCKELGYKEEDTE